MLIAEPLVTERLMLRCLAPEDVSDVYVDWLNDGEVNRYLEIRFIRHSLESTLDFVRKVNASPDNLLLGMHELDSRGRHIGNIKLGPILTPHGRADIGLLIGAADARGRGYGREAIAAVTAFGHRHLGLRKLTAGYYAGNLGSARAFAAAGYVVEARLTAHWQSDSGIEDGVIVAHFAPLTLPEPTLNESGAEVTRYLF